MEHDSQLKAYIVLGRKSLKSVNSSEVRRFYEESVGMKPMRTIMTEPTAVQEKCG